MANQQHVILRQVLEIGACPPDQARRVHDVVRDIYYRRLLPAIDRACSDLSAPGRIHRIERLEVDLGEVALDALEPALADAFDDAFATALARALDAVPSEEVDEQLELFGHFIRTGTLPWWADRSNRGLLDATLSALIDRAPAALRQAILSVPEPETARHRLVTTYSDEQLDALTRVLAWPQSTSRVGGGSQWLALVAAAAKAHGAPASAARRVWWNAWLGALIEGETFLPDRPRALGAVLIASARRLGIAARPFAASLRQALERSDVSLPSCARDVVESIDREETADRADGDPSVVGRRVTDRVLLDPSPWPAVPSSQSASPDRVDGARVDGIGPVDGLPARADGRTTTRDDGTARMDGGSAPVEKGGGRPSSGRAEGEALARGTRADQPTVKSRLSGSVVSPASLRFSDANELYVDNAGLVLLWPFLQSFFTQLGLIEGKQFKDAAAQQRAIGLLQQVATGEPAPPEFLLPLNKVLCGSAPDDVFEFGPPMSDAEIEACTNLLTAAIHQAPILHEMSVRGFRGSFLLREGQLSVRDGGWLLRVTRATHDIVLDRFPWGTSIVKLPWMAAIMYVEW